MLSAPAITSTENAEDQAAGYPGDSPGLGEPQSYTERPMIPVDLLTAHPGNVREDRQADEALCRSVAAVGVLVPLEITVDPDSGYRVVDGNLRLDAAIRAGLSAVPYFFSADTASDEGLQYLHMIITSRFRRDLSVQEEAAALFQASELGMSRTDIRKVTGLKASDVKAGISAGSLNPETRAMTAQMDYEWDLEELALLRPFEDDAEAMADITAAAAYGRPIRYVIQRIIDDREAEARKAAVIAELTTAGITVTPDWPAGAVSLSRLLDGDQEMTTEAHAACPGRGATIPAWRGAEPVHYCVDPARYGHVFAGTGTTTPPAPVTSGGPAGRDRKPPADRKIVVEGNRAWKAAGTVRQQWLGEFFTRKAPPRDAATAIARFVTGQIVTMPAPLCRGLGGARQTRLFELFGKPDPDAVAKSTVPGLWMLALVPVAVAYELEMTGDGEHRNTWRTDGKYSPCSRKDAGAWLRFTAEIGYPLSPIEQAVADEVPYLGDSPAEPGTDTDTGTPARDSQKEEDRDAGDDTASQEDETAPGEAEGAGTQAQAGTEQADTATADAGTRDHAGPRSAAGSPDQASAAAGDPGETGPADHARAVAA